MYDFLTFLCLAKWKSLKKIAAVFSLLTFNFKLLPPFEHYPHLEIKIKSQKYIYRPGAFRGEDSHLVGHSEDYGSFPNSLKLCVLDRRILLYFLSN